MKTFHRLMTFLFLLITLLFVAVNLLLKYQGTLETARPYRVEINRIANELEEKDLESIDFSKCEYVTNIVPLTFEDNSFNETDSDYAICKVGDQFYRFDYSYNARTDQKKVILIVNISLSLLALLLLWVLLYIRKKILLPFTQLTAVPYELSRGNLTIPLSEQKSRYFGKFVWGLNMLRETIEEQKQRELELQKEKKLLLLSISHDIKTPLSAIKLYAKALSKGLYLDQQKQFEIAENINARADDIEGFVAQIVKASKEDFLNLEVHMSEFYLSTLVEQTYAYYHDKLSLLKTQYIVKDYSNCLLKGDLDRSIEILQNIMENAIKYGDGTQIELSFSEEENCQLISISNTGCTLSPHELPHIFESFYRGSNSEHKRGNGLGLYICRQLLHSMGGEIFAEIQKDVITVTCVFIRA